MPDNSPQGLHVSTASESAAAKRDTPKVFLALLGAMVAAAVGVLAVGAKFMFH